MRRKNHSWLAAEATVDAIAWGEAEGHTSGGESEPGYSQRTVRRGSLRGSLELKPLPRSQAQMPMG